MEHTNELLAASGMVGRGRHLLDHRHRSDHRGRRRPAVSVGGNLAQDAPVGAHVTVIEPSFNNVGKEIPLQLEFTRTADGWSMQAASKGQAIGQPSNVTFDASGERTSTDVTLGRADLDVSTTPAVPGRPRASRSRSARPNDPNRVEMGAGTSKMAVLEQNGGDGSEPHRRRHRYSHHRRRSATADRRPRRSIGVGDGGASTGPVIDTPRHDVRATRAIVQQLETPREDPSCSVRCSPQSPDSRRTRRSWTSSGNNIANVNTTGFKAGTVEFEDLLSQTMHGAGAPASAIAGGTNPAQVGLGVRLAGIGMNFSQGASQSTGRSTDFAIQGDGFFVVQPGRRPGLHAQRQLHARRSRPARDRRRRPRAGLAGRPARATSTPTRARRR